MVHLPQAETHEDEQTSNEEVCHRECLLSIIIAVLYRHKLRRITSHLPLGLVELHEEVLDSGHDKVDAFAIFRLNDSTILIAGVILLLA